MSTRASSARSQVLAAADAKARLYALLDEVSRDGAEFIVTRRGKAVARLTPIATAAPERPGEFGCLRHLVVTMGDVVSPLAEDEWTTPRCLTADDAVLAWAQRGHCAVLDART